MNQFVRIAFCFLLVMSVARNTVLAQAGIFNPSDPVVNYDSKNPPVQPKSGLVGKWVRTPRVSWNTSAFKCYIYNGMCFRLKYPKNYDSTKTYPILIFFHGLGEYGTIYDNEYQLYLGGTAHANAVDNGKLEGFLLYPQNTQEMWSSGNVTNVYNLIEKVMIPQKKVDPFRVYVNGLSAGGATTWNFLAKYTKLVAAATPISAAYSSMFDSAQKYKFTPIFHFQGGQDTDPAPSSARSLGNKILGIGGNYKYKEFPDRGHDCWNQAWADPDYFPFYARAYKSNPWPLFGRTDFCQNDPIGLTLGVTPGFEGYEWRKNGVLIADATTNTLQVTELGTYDCRILKGTTWSAWSPIPVTISIKQLTVQPAIYVSSAYSSVAIPAPDGSTTVPLQVPEGYASYQWAKEGSTTVLSNTNTFNAPAAGNYRVQVTEKWGCGLATGVVAVPATATRTQAENYTAMSGVQKETCKDAGGGQDVGYIDPNDWMDYKINAPTSGTYTAKFRLANSATGAMFEVRGPSGRVLTTVNVPNTGSWQKFVDVTTTIPLIGGLQTIRLYSIATPRWNINYFDLTNPAGNSGTADGFSQSFPVLDAAAANGPDAITNLTATTLSKTSIQLTWNQTATPAYNETGFEVYEATAADEPYKFKALTAANATGISFSGLNSGVAYFYKVRAVNANAASAVVGPVTTTTQADITAPTAPTILSVGAITRSSIELQWSAATDDVGVYYYDIYINGVKWYAFSKSVTKATMYNLLPNTSYNFYMVARDLAGNVSAQSNTITAKTTTGYLKIDPNMGSNPLNFSVYINMNADNPAAAPWNNTNTLPNEGVKWSNFRNYASNVSGVDMTILTNFSGYNPNGMNTGANSGVYPDNVLRSSYYCDKGQTAVVKIYDLSVNHKYSFIFFGSRNGTGDRTSVYKIGNQSVSLNASLNTTQTVQIDNVVPDQNGVVIFEVSLGPNSIFAYLNSLVIKGYSLTQPTSAMGAAATTMAVVTEDTVVTATATAYPNPVQNEVTISVPVSKATPALTVQLTDAAGGVLQTRKYPNVAQGVWQQRIPMTGGASLPGIYFIHISGLGDGKEQVLKIVKVK